MNIYEIEFNDSGNMLRLLEFSDFEIDRVAKENGYFGEGNFFTVYRNGEEIGGGDFEH